MSAVELNLLNLNSGTDAQVPGIRAGKIKWPSKLASIEF